MIYTLLIWIIFAANFHHFHLSYSEWMVKFCVYYYCGVTWASWHLESPATQVIVQQPLQAKHKLHITGLLWGETTNDQWQGFHSHRASYAEVLSMPWRLYAQRSIRVFPRKLKLPLTIFTTVAMGHSCPFMSRSFLYHNDCHSSMI